MIKHKTRRVGILIAPQNKKAIKAGGASDMFLVIG